MKTDKEIYDVLIPYAKKRAGECNRCIDGKIVMVKPPAKVTHLEDLLDSEISGTKPCPVCSGIREVAGMCWHELPLGNVGNCKNCGQHFIAYCNPTFTITFIVETFKKMGVWERFIYNHLRYEIDVNCDGWAGQTPEIDKDTLIKFADILTTETLMREAAYEFLKEAV